MGHNEFRSMFGRSKPETGVLFVYESQETDFQADFQVLPFGKTKVCLMIQSHLITIERKLLGHVLYGMARNIGQEDREI